MVTPWCNPRIHHFAISKGLNLKHSGPDYLPFQSNEDIDKTILKRNSQNVKKNANCLKENAIVKETFLFLS